MSGSSAVSCDHLRSLGSGARNFPRILISALSVEQIGSIQFLEERPIHPFYFTSFLMRRYMIEEVRLVSSQTNKEECE